MQFHQLFEEEEEEAAGATWEQASKSKASSICLGR
jgi:hypothetical protein